MSSNKQVITIRVSEQLKAAFEQACIKEKRSMSKQGELLIEEYIRSRIVIVDEANGISDDIWEGLRTIRDKAS